MIERDFNLMPFRLRTKARGRIIECLQRTTEDINYLEMKKRNKQYRPDFKVPLKADRLHTIRKSIDVGDEKAAVQGLSDLNDSLERFEKRIFSSKKRHF